MIVASGTTEMGPGPAMPLVRPTPYRTWAPPVSGVGRVTGPLGSDPSAPAVTVPSTAPVGESNR